jgi:hypothetical protein
VRRLLGLALLGGGSALFLRRREARRDRVDLCFDDGSAVTLHRGAPGAEPLLAAARQAL